VTNGARWICKSHAGLQGRRLLNLQLAPFDSCYVVQSSAAVFSLSARGLSYYYFAEIYRLQPKASRVCHSFVGFALSKDILLF